MARNNDQLVAPAPTVVFATDQAKEQIVADLTTRYQQASHYAANRWGDAAKNREAVSALKTEISERMALIELRDTEMQQAEMDAQNGRDVAKGLADLLAVAGVQIPPYGGELSHNPEGAIRNFESAHDELDRGALS